MTSKARHGGNACSALALLEPLDPAENNNSCQNLTELMSILILKAPETFPKMAIGGLESWGLEYGENACGSDAYFR